jgi:hypothetical protein
MQRKKIQKKAPLSALVQALFCPDKNTDTGAQAGAENLAWSSRQDELAGSLSLDIISDKRSGAGPP